MAGLPADSKKAYLLINICHTRMTRPMAGIDGGFMALYDLWYCIYGIVCCVLIQTFHHCI